MKAFIAEVEMPAARKSYAEEFKRETVASVEKSGNRFPPGCSPDFISGFMLTENRTE